MHWSGAHRFFSHSHWDADALGRARASLAVNMFVPFGMLTLTILTCCYHHAGRAADDLAT